MTSTSSVISLSNRALLQVGARSQISSLSEGSVEADAIKVLFQPTFEQLARTAPWNCLRKELALTLIAAASGTPENPDGTTLPLPPVPWLYSYALPSDCLDVRYIMPSLPAAASGSTPLTTASVTSSTWFPNGGQIPFVVAYATDLNNNPITVILTNQTLAIGVYTVNQPNPTIWDSLLEQAFVSSLAVFLVPALSLQIPLMQLAMRSADQAISIARVRDGNEGVLCMDHLPDWMSARVGGIGRNNYNGNQGPTYASMCWPAY